MLKWSITGRKELKRKLGAVQRKARGRSPKEVRRVARGIERRMKKLAPRLSGDLADSIRTEFDPDGLGFVVGPRVRYSFWVIYGKPRNPFVHKAFKSWSRSLVRGSAKMMAKIAKEESL